ncbi:RagB/SusD family nutrient uptake outer membrane protein [Dysgonomonas sp. Marseille-P4677]|uniref:RagB/SusD family nutrient uptake outer membrane protein n=1 Tax=Dysgonomonas sp. Marseille-P4677 TaxID=2364790 RepID=UPI0019122EFA|nr:RagB/SusD family nutrient uptake outer membrane protein [Dysgonomonas sp. Marseille-P4677]MBK5720585.1 RagB/SusD family nutrient uptake outer membrane protein [Dysgonomonas sp. Marseille-P4677]
MKNFKIFYLFLLSIILMPSCTDLGEEAFSVIPLEKYYNDKNSVEAAVLRPYEHGHWCAWDGDRWLLQELTGDHFVWTQKGKHGWDEGQWVRLHKHNWDYLQNQIYGSWTGPYQGIGYINNTLNDFNTLDLSNIISEQEKKAYIAELRVLRVWYYSFLIDFFRYIPISEDNLTIKGQSTPQEVFDYMEKELKDAMPELSKEPAIGRHGQASAASILVRMYLNAKVWTGVDRSVDCITVAQDIIGGKYGIYSIDGDYRGPFQSFMDNRSPENIFEWPHKRNVYELGWMYSAFHHYKSNSILDTDGWNGYNGIHLSPSRDLDGTIYDFAMGKPYEKFADVDYRKQNYEVINSTGNTKGFFLIGVQYEFDKAKGYGYDKSKPVTGSEEWTGKPLVFVDQVGRFSEKPNGRWNEGSHVTTGEENSGVRLMKFGPLSHSRSLFMANSIAEIRLAEIYYSLAECLYKQGNKTEAAKLLDEVRKRNYPEAEWASYSYEDNLPMLTDQEFIDEWGREFLGEHRRRIDLIRWGRFGDAWWDKDVDKTDKEYTIFPIPSKALNANPLLEQTTRGW